MFTTISWGMYWSFVACLLLVYYAVILFFLYRKSFLGRLPHVHIGIRLQDTSKETDIAENVTHDTAGPVSGAPEYGPVFLQSLEDELESFFESVDADTSTKETLLASVKKIIGKYPTIKGTANQLSISNLIVFLAEQHSSVHLSIEEAGSVWI